MVKLITKCPACGGGVKIAALSCTKCGLELRADFNLNPIDTLNDMQTEFLYAFLRHRGNLKSLQDELAISYPNAKKQLNDLLIALNLAKPETKINKNNISTEKFDMSNWNITQTSTQPSEIVKRKLAECGGTVTVYTLRGKPCEIYGSPSEFTSDKFRLTNGNEITYEYTYEYTVFDVIVNFLKSRGGRAVKGSGHYRVGEPGCDKTTVAGALAYNYFDKVDGESIPDPISVFAAILDWAGIARNTRGELVLTDTYKN